MPPPGEAENRGKCADGAKAHLPLSPSHHKDARRHPSCAKPEKGGRRPLLGLPFPTTGGRRYFTFGSQKAYPARPDFPLLAQIATVEPSRAISRSGRYISRPNLKTLPERLLDPSTAILHACSLHRIAPDAREGAFTPFLHLGR